MKTLMMVVAGTCFAAAANADLSSTPFNPDYVGDPSFAVGFDYEADDSTAEQAIGLTAGGVIAAINQFDSLGSVGEIGVAWGSPAFPGSSGVTPGQQFGVGVWSDPNQDGDPSDGGFIVTAVGAVDAGSIDTDVKQIVDVPDVNIPAGDSFFIVSWVEHAPGFFPMAQDTSSAYDFSTSWVSGGAGTFDPGSFPLDLLGEIGGFGLPGYWLLAANVIPAPSAAAVLGLGVLAARRRR
jgi:hypothetical protein